MEPDAVFVLDLAANPHPRLKELANTARGRMASSRSSFDVGYWRGIVDAMVAATGCPEVDILDWLAR